MRFHIGPSLATAERWPGWWNQGLQGEKIGSGSVGCGLFPGREEVSVMQEGEGEM